MSRPSVRCGILAVLTACVAVGFSPRSRAADESDENGQPPAKPELVLEGGHVLTLDERGELPEASIVIGGGRILAVGDPGDLPDNVRRIDVTGLTVAPGLIDCRSQLWLTDSGPGSASDGSLNAADGIDPYADDWTAVARHGVTTVSIQPEGILGGLSIVLRVAPGGAMDELVLRRDAAMQGSIGLTGRTGTSRDRYAQYEALKKRFDAAKKYRDAWAAYREAVSEAAKAADKDNAADANGDGNGETPPADSAERRGDRRGRGRPVDGGSRGQGRNRRGTDHGRPDGAPADDDSDAKESKPTDDSSSEPPRKPDRDPLKDLLVRVLNKELLLRIEAHRADDVAAAIRLADEFDCEFVLEGATHAGRSWDMIRAERPPLVVGDFLKSENQPTSSADAHRFFRELSAYDGPIAIATFGSSGRASRLLRHHAAAAIAAGIPHDVVLRAVTSDAARILGVDSHVGTLAPGKQADLFVVAGDPLDPSAPVRLTLSRGEIVYESHRELVPHASPLVDVADVPERFPEAFALVSERVLFPNGRFAPAAIHVRDGKISAVNRRKRAGNLPVIDVGAAVVTPGLIAAHVVSQDQPSTAASLGWVHAADGLDPQHEGLRELTEAGFTAAAFAPDSRSVVAGQIGCVRIAGTPPVPRDDSAAPIAIASKFVLADASRNRERFPAALAGQLQLIDAYFAGEPQTANLYVPDAVSALLESAGRQQIAALTSQAVPAVIEAQNAAEIDAALAMISARKLRGVLLHPQDFRHFLDELQATNTAIIARPAAHEDHDWFVDDLVAAGEAGIPVAISGADPAAIRRTLALMVSAGMTAEAALRAMTSDAADLCGLPGCGRLERGASADLVIWSGSPLNPAARPVRVLVDGSVVKETK